MLCTFLVIMMCNYDDDKWCFYCLAPPTGECFLDISMNGTCTGLMGTASPPENCCSINAVVAYDIMGDELGCMPCTSKKMYYSNINNNKKV